MEFSRKSHRINWRNTVFAIFLLLLTASIVAGADKGELAGKLDEYLQAAHKVWKFHGAALVAKDGKPILKKGYGMASIELGVPSSPKNKYLIGSITKQFTAAAILQLVEKGLVDLQAPITKYLPDYPKETGDKVTIHYLLRHSSGVPSYTDDVELMGRRTAPGSLEEILATFKDEPLEFEPGTKYKYSNSGYVLLGMVIEAASGKSYEEYIKENIFDVVGMANSGYAHHDLIIPDRAVGYTTDDNDDIINAYVVHASWPYSAGALYSTVEDMLLWDQALYTEKVLSKASLDQMFTPGLGDYGYGWVIRDVFKRKLIRHNGGIDGFHTSFNRWVDDGVCIAVFSNNDMANSDGIAAGLAAITLGQPYELPVKKTPIEIDPEILADYEGVYRADSVDYRIMSVEDGRLYSMRTGGGRIEIFPQAKDKFYFDHDEMLVVEFVRNADGEVVEHIMHRQLGDDPPCTKVSDSEAEQVLAKYKPAEVDPAIFADYVGSYQLMPEFMLEVTLQEDRLFMQATGQEIAELFPRSESRFFLKVVDAEIDFERDDSGKVVRLILHQGGRDMPAERIK